VLDEHAAVGSGQCDGHVSMAEVDPGDESFAPTGRQKGCRPPSCASFPNSFGAFLDYELFPDQPLNSLGNRAARQTREATQVVPRNAALLANEVEELIPGPLSSGGPPLIFCGHVASLHLSANRSK
jgi:hypothetical protein